MDEYERLARRQSMLARIMAAKSPRDLVILLMQEGWRETKHARISDAERNSEWVHDEYPYTVRINQEQGEDGFWVTRVRVTEEIFTRDYKG